MRRTLLFPLFFISFFSFAQKKEAIVITTNNETINGIVDDKEWLSNPSMIRIKKAGSSSFTEYYPSQVKSIRIKDGDYYESYNISIDNTPTEFEGAILDSSLISYTQKHAFLLVQFETPELTLYSYRSKNQLRFYLKKGNNIPEELIYRKYTVRRSNGIFEMEDNQYIQQLDFLTSSCDAVTKKMDKITYSLSHLLDLLNSYYSSCNKSVTAYLRTQPDKGKFSVSLLAGASKTSLRFKNGNPDAVFVGVITRTGLKTTVTPAAGLKLNYNIPRAHKKVSISLEMYYNKFTASTFEYLYNNSQDDYQTKSLSIGASYLHTTLGLRYALNRESKIRPFLLAGVSESFILSHQAEAIYDKHYFGTNTTTHEYPFPDNALKKASLGFFIGAGISYNRFGLDIRHHMLGNLARFSFVSSPMTAATLLVSYQLTR